MKKEIFSPKFKKVFSILLPILVLVAVWFTPPPQGLPVLAWKMFGIFAAAIVAILTQPLSTGAVMLLALVFTILTKVLPESKALAGFSSSVVWLIFSAYILSLGFIKTGFGRRIAYKLLSLFGGSSLGIAYALGVSDFFMAPAMPSVTARSAGIIFPIARSINEVLGSHPGETGKKIGNYLVMTCFQFAPITGAMFMTGMAANPLAADLAMKVLKIQISWVGWTAAAIVPALFCFAIMPYLLYKVLDPELKNTPEAKEMGKRALGELGPMKRQEWYLASVFLLALVGWGTSLITGFGATTVGIGVIALMFVLGVVDWKDVLKDQAMWDTVIWFGAIISLATGLGELGFIKWVTASLGSLFSGWSWLFTFLILGLIYMYIHYAFATTSGHVAAMYAPFVAIVIAAGAPPMMVAICFGIFGNIMWGLTEYGGGPGPIYFAQGYFSRMEFYRLGLIVVTVNVIIVLTIGVAWWKVIGLW